MLRFRALRTGLFAYLACGLLPYRSAQERIILGRPPPKILPVLLLDRGEEQNLISPIGEPIPGVLGTPDLLLPAIRA